MFRLFLFHWLTFLMSEVGMGLCYKEQVGVDIVKFWLSKDYREMMVTYIAPLVCLGSLR